MRSMKFEILKCVLNPGPNRSLRNFDRGDVQTSSLLHHKRGRKQTWHNDEKLTNED